MPIGLAEISISFVSCLLFSVAHGTKNIDGQLERAFRLRNPQITYKPNPTQHRVAESGSSPNLFELKDLADQKIETCKQAFDLFYNQSFAQFEPKANHVIRILEGNRSQTEGWDFFFNRGNEDTEGYANCFQENSEDVKKIGVGPCATAFHGEECPYFPDFPIGIKAHPACCDAYGCTCFCIYQCTTLNQIKMLLETFLPDREYPSCTTNVTSMEQAEKWRTQACAEDQGSLEHLQVQEKCLNMNGTQAECIKEGFCMKSVCKFCSKWKCGTKIEKLGIKTFSFRSKLPLNSRDNEQNQQIKNEILDQIMKAYEKLKFLDDI